MDAVTLCDSQLNLIRVNSKTCMAAISPDRAGGPELLAAILPPDGAWEEVHVEMSRQERRREAQHWDIIEFPGHTMPNPANPLSCQCPVPMDFAFLCNSISIGYCFLKWIQRSKTGSSMRYNFRGTGRAALLITTAGVPEWHQTWPPLPSLFWVEHFVN